jgi:hypothetical protein
MGDPGPDLVESQRPEVRRDQLGGFDLAVPQLGMLMELVALLEGRGSEAGDRVGDAAVQGLPVGRKRGGARRGEEQGDTHAKSGEKGNAPSYPDDATAPTGNATAYDRLFRSSGSSTRHTVSAMIA